MKSQRKNKPAVAKLSAVVTKRLRAGVIEASEIHLVAGKGRGTRERLSITIDKKSGYPNIRMGDLDGPNQGVTKIIEIGFDVSPHENWPYVKLSVGRGGWECSTMSVVDREQQTYPETSMSQQGNIKSYYAVTPKGEASLELWGTEGRKYVITGNTPAPAHVSADEQRCSCDRIHACAKRKTPHRLKKTARATTRR